MRESCKITSCLYSYGSVATQGRISKNIHYKILMFIYHAVWEYV